MCDDTAAVPLTDEELDALAEYYRAADPNFLSEDARAVAELRAYRAADPRLATEAQVVALIRAWPNDEWEWWDLDDSALDQNVADLLSAWHSGEVEPGHEREVLEMVWWLKDVPAAVRAEAERMIRGEA